MWIFTTRGFISAVQHREQPDQILVRARRQEHLEAIIPGCTVTVIETADYRYRTQISKDLLAATLAQEAEQIDYANFKGAIADHAYHDACMDVWTAMHRIQPGSYLARSQSLHWPHQPTLGAWADEEDEDRHCRACGVGMSRDDEAELCVDCDLSQAPAF